MDLYKSKLLSKNILVMLGIHVGFLFSIEKFEETCKLNNLFESFLEFVVLYYPETKIKELIEVLIEQNTHRGEFLVFQRNVLEDRETTTKANISFWTKNSKVLKNLFEESLEVLEDLRSENLQAAWFLEKTTRDFLS